ncbi:AMP-binding protein [Staphylococcus lutrae]|uniref:AMP-binding protein n=1 Tax=Staphylococcus lutrae TaxID=155085 RepID=UPI001F0BE443|nr:AMP-binding protein [Staphylococcus lutrae]
MLELLNQLKIYAQEKPEHVALWLDNSPITYETLWKSVQEESEALPDAIAFQNVLLVHTRTAHFIVAYLAVRVRQGVPCVLGAQWSTEQRDALIALHRIPYIWGDEGLMPTSFEQLNEALAIPQLLHIGFTSGTTGLPKGFIRDWPSWTASFAVNDTLLDCSVQMYMALGPYAHSLTLYVMIYALWNGKTFIGQDQYDMAKAWSYITKIQQTCALFLVPTMAYDTIHLGQTSHWIRHIFISGDKLSPSRHAQLKAIFPEIPIDEFFGTSEASFISVNRNQSAPLNSVGYVFPNVAVRIHEQDATGVGQLLVRSPMTFSGYIGEGKVSEWIATGDYARLEGNMLYLHGRVKDRLIIGGKNVYPAMIEQQLKQWSGIVDTVIVSHPHDKLGELGIALYIGSAQLDVHALRQWLSSRVSRYEIPSKFICVRSLPLTASGKVSRAEAQRRYDKGEYL